jgi:hypothetical protein
MGLLHREEMERAGRQNWWRQVVEDSMNCKATELRLRGRPTVGWKKVLSPPQTACVWRQEIRLWGSFPWGFRPKFFMHISSSPCITHVVQTHSLSFNHLNNNKWKIQSKEFFKFSRNRCQVCVSELTSCKRLWSCWRPLAWSKVWKAQ